MTQHNALIDARNVSFDIGDASILQEFSLSIADHRIGVVGRNGSGKSTFGRLLCGLIEPSSGSLTIANIDVAKDRRGALKTVGMLFQNPDHQIIFPTVEEEISFGLRQMGSSKSEALLLAHDWLGKFNVQHWAQKSVVQLSQGQRHLVCLMSVLAMRPKLIVLDEPYAGLDIPTTSQLKQIINNVDAAVVHISHDPQMLCDYDRVLWFDEGQIIGNGPADETLQAFTHKMNVLGQQDALI